MKNFKPSTKWLFLGICLSLTVVLASCGKNDDKEETNSGNLANELVGTYTGEITMAKPMYSGPATVVVTKTGDDSVKFNFSSPESLVGTVSLESGLKSVGSNDILGTTPGIVNVLYYRKEKNLTYQGTLGTNQFSFQGTK